MDRYLHEWPRSYPLYKIHYYAWKPGTNLDKSEEGLIRTLLYQVLHQNPDLTPLVCPRRWTLFHTIRELRLQFYPAWTIEELHESFAYMPSIAQNSMRLAVFVATRGSKITLNISEVDIEQVYATLQRRVSARTRGILELVRSTKTVEYLHRTAAEWIKQPRVLERLQFESPKDFDPFMCLLRAGILQIEYMKDDFSGRETSGNELPGRCSMPLLWITVSLPTQH